MTTAYTLYGWQVSYYTGKVRSYLRCKGIPFVEISPNLFNYYVSLRRKTGTVAIPVLKTPDGAWLQDSSEIIDHLEQQFPSSSILPDAPIPRMLAFLFELWGDEFWLPTGLQTRWCHMEENYPFLEKDVANDLLPGWPHWLQKKAAAQVAQHMYQYLPKAGVVPEQYAVLNRWTERQLDALDQHFAKLPFLLGTRPSLGDFGLMAPLYGHLSRDPWPSRNLIQPRKHLSAWIARMNQAQLPSGQFINSNVLPPTLEPLIASLLGEMVPYLEGLARVAQAATASTKRLPRFMETIEFPMGDARFRRPAMPYGLWMLQRMLDNWRAMPPSDAQEVRAWLRSHGAERLLDLPLPRLHRQGLQVAVAQPLHTPTSRIPVSPAK